MESSVDSSPPCSCTGDCSKCCVDTLHRELDTKGQHKADANFKKHFLGNGIQLTLPESFSRLYQIDARIPDCKHSVETRDHVKALLAQVTGVLERNASKPTWSY